MFWQYAWKSFWRRRTKATLAIAGVAFSVALLVAVLSISQAVQRAVADALNAAGADMVIQRRVKPCPFAEVKLPKDLAAFPADVADKLAEHPAVEQVSAVLELWAFYQGHPTVVAGIDPSKKTLGPVRIAPREEEGEEAKCCAVVRGATSFPQMIITQWSPSSTQKPKASTWATRYTSAQTRFSKSSA